MILLIPFVPHLANECLENLGSNKKKQWPKSEKKVLNNEKVNIVIQINGKTRDVIKMKKNVEEKYLLEFVSQNTKAKKFLENKLILKTIYIKNKIINFVIKN